MAELTPVLDAAGVNALLRKAFPDAVPAAFPTVLDVAPGRVSVMAPYDQRQARNQGLRHRRRARYVHDLLPASVRSGAMDAIHRRRARRDNRRTAHPPQPLPAGKAGHVWLSLPVHAFKTRRP